jgi:hypothetical protein
MLGLASYAVYLCTLSRSCTSGYRARVVPLTPAARLLRRLCAMVWVWLLCHAHALSRLTIAPHLLAGARALLCHRRSHGCVCSRLCAWLSCHALSHLTTAPHPLAGARVVLCLSCLCGCMCVRLRAWRAMHSHTSPQHLSLLAGARDVSYASLSHGCVHVRLCAWLSCHALSHLTNSYTVGVDTHNLTQHNCSLKLC